MHGRGAVVLACAVCALLTLAAAFNASTNGSGAEVILVLDGPGQFHALPKLTTDIRPSEEREHFVSVELVVEVDDAGRSRLEDNETEIVDALQSLLRDYERDDLIGRQGALRLRADALYVIERIIAPAQAKDVLFKQFIVD